MIFRNLGHGFNHTWGGDGAIANMKFLGVRAEIDIDGGKIQLALGPFNQRRLYEKIVQF